MLSVNSIETFKWGLGRIIPHYNYKMCYWIVEKGDTYPTTAVRFEARVNPEKAWDMQIKFLIWSTLFL